jgi:hypothetical protein
MTTFKINILELNERTLALLQLLKLEKSIEVIEENMDVPQWQQDLVNKRIKDTKEEDYVSWDEIEKNIKFD